MIHVWCIGGMFLSVKQKYQTQICRNCEYLKGEFNVNLMAFTDIDRIFGFWKGNNPKRMAKVGHWWYLEKGSSFYYIILVIEVLS